MKVELHLGDCLEVMAELPENSVDTILTDPPYGLEFMGKDWDRGVPGVAFWEQALHPELPRKKAERLRVFLFNLGDENGN